MEQMRYKINAPQVITETIDGEAIMINLGTGNYYSVGGSGADVCSWLEDGIAVDEMVEGLAARYDGPPETIAGSLRRLLDDLEREELIVAVDSIAGASARTPPADSVARRPFAPPKLDKYTDMQDLVLLDPVHEVAEQGWPHVQSGAAANDGAAS
jgi:hypothetical protein